MPEYISKIVLPNGQTYLIKDQEARDLIEQIQAGGLTFVISSDASSTPEGIVWEDDTSEITGTLQASSSTKAYIYLVPHKKTGTSVDYYREYVTVELPSGSGNYFWEFLGTTDIDLSGLGDMAYTDTATGTTSLDNYVTGANFSNGAVNASGSFTPNGSISVTLSQTQQAASIVYGDYTPAGTINKPAINVDPTLSSFKVGATDGAVTAGTAATFNEGAFTPATFSHTADVYSSPVLTMSVPNPSVSSASQYETLIIGWTSGTFTEGAFTFTGGSKAADTFTANTPTAVTLPTFSSASIMTNLSAELAAAPTFTGTTQTSVIATAVNYSQATVQAATFSGTAGTVNVSGTATGDISLTSTSKTITIQVSPDTPNPNA